jgi:hypothetical protein
MLKNSYFQPKSQRKDSPSDILLFITIKARFAAILEKLSLFPTASNV